MFSLARAHRRATTLTAALLLGAGLAVGGAALPALAEDGGPARIGPGYSDNHTGVTCIQKFLGVQMRNGTQYGVYGQVTYQAVKKFQTGHGLDADGAVGATTAKAMLDAGMTASCRAHLPSTAANQPPADGGRQLTVQPPAQPPANPNSIFATCTRSAQPNVADYASGAECPPAGFPYEPIMRSTKAGKRATDPFGDGCSHSPEKTKTYDFTNACATHDYLADLQRYGAKGVPEAGMDNVFFLDMVADCQTRKWTAAPCRAAASTYRALVNRGNYEVGDKIKTTK